MRTKEQILSNKKEYYIKNREHILIRRKIYGVNNKELLQRKNKRYYIDNKDKILLVSKSYYQQNRKRIITRSIEYEKKRIVSDINYKLRKRLRGRVKMALNGNYKTGRTIEMLGCSIDEFRKHLESKFQDGMSWKNYGEWHIDHIIPCASFDLSKVDEQRKCFHYTNQQPLWAVDNLRKSKY
jgi:hypothetical protein